MKITGNLNTTDSRDTTETLVGKLTSQMKAQKGYDILKEYLSDEELGENDRWFDIEKNEVGKLFATTGTVDLEYYIEVSEFNN